MFRNVMCVVVIIFFGCNMYLLISTCYPQVYQRSSPSGLAFESPSDFLNFDNELGTPNGKYIIPNIVHFIKFGKTEMSFINAVCIFAALINQKPKKLIIHTDRTDMPNDKYWNVILKHPLAQNRVEIRYLPPRREVFGQKLSDQWQLHHAADLARLEVLMAEGGIYLDGDSYVVRSLDDFRRYEMTLGWQEGGGISNQVIIAHKNARFLPLWYEGYKEYRRDQWFYNAGVKPTQMLLKQPHLVHRVPWLLAEWINTTRMIYLERSQHWKVHFVIHLLINHQYVLKRNLSKSAVYPVVFDDMNINSYNANIRDMVKAVYPFDLKSKN